MGIFFFIDDRLINLDDPLSIVKDEYHERFARQEFAPFILSEVCVLDMLYMITAMKDGYYKERLSLKGGLSVRSAVPLADHRFSFDADFDPNSRGGFTFRHVRGLKDDIIQYGLSRGCTTPIKITQDNQRWRFIKMGYRESLGRYKIKEIPKIEVCKTCRVFDEPVYGPIDTIVDLELLGLEQPKVTHLSLEEQLATKLFIIGSSGRQRNHFDAYDAFRMLKNNDPDMKKVRGLFKKQCTKPNSNPRSHAAECISQLDAMLKNTGKRTSLEETAFGGDFSFDTMVDSVKSFYNF